MLRRIYIRNIALIDKIEIVFGRGFNVITGETGAGKSITVEALLLILGDRASSQMLREGTDKGNVEACFTIDDQPETKNILQSAGLVPDDNELIVKREIASDGKSRAFVNGSQVNVSFLKSLGEKLLDLHGQHEHQSLLKKPHQKDFLDAYSGTYVLRDKVKENYERLRGAYTKKEIFENTTRDKNEQIDFLKFQEKELLDLQMEDGNEEMLENEYKIASQSEKVRDHVNKIDEVISGANPSIMDHIRRLLTTLQELSAIDHTNEENYQSVQEIQFRIEELESAIKSKYQDLEVDPARKLWLEEHLFEVKRLKKRYGEDLGRALYEIQQKIDALENVQKSLDQINHEINTLKKEYDINADKLSVQRIVYAKKLSKSIVKELADLGMRGASFRIEVTKTEDGPTGKDEICFYISTNVGQSQRLMQEIISGGELSRVMLALKTQMRKKIIVPNLIFDEIDVNLGGETAKRVGEKLRDISKNHQIIVITHLATIAAYAKHHFCAEKTTRQRGVFVQVRAIKDRERIKEIARMLGGDSFQREALTHAEKLVSTSR